MFVVSIQEGFHLMMVHPYTCDEGRRSNVVLWRPTNEETRAIFSRACLQRSTRNSHHNLVQTAPPTYEIAMVQRKRRRKRTRQGKGRSDEQVWRAPAVVR